MKADLSKELPTRIKYNIQGKETIVDFTYPWLPPKCTICGRWVHYATFCKEDQKEIREKGSISEEVKEANGQESEVTRSVTEHEVVNEKSQEEAVAGEQERVVENGKENEEGDINEWQRVSQEKASRTPKSKDLKFDQVMIATPSRYAALSNSGENGEDIEHERL